MVRDAPHPGHLPQPHLSQHVQEQLLGPAVADRGPAGGQGPAPTQETRPQLQQDRLGVAQRAHQGHALSGRAAP